MWAYVAGGILILTGSSLALYVILAWVAERERRQAVKSMPAQHYSEDVGLGLWYLEHHRLRGEVWAAALLAYIEELHRDVLAAQQEAAAVEQQLVRVVQQQRLEARHDA